MTSQPQHLYLLSFSGELSIKSKATRKRFSKRLADNLEQGLAAAGIPYELERTWARLYLRSPAAEAGDVARRIFGVQAVSTVVERPWESLEDVVEDGAELFAERVAEKTFAVRARRGGSKERVPFRSPDLERALGTRLLSGSAGVDLTSPEVTVAVELRRERAYFVVEQRPGPGGLPLGTEGRALALVSGGFDSAVAAWLMLRRGVLLDYLFCNLGGDAHRDAVFSVLKVLADGWSHGYRPRLAMVDFQPLVEEIQERSPPRLWQVVLKRQMLRAANEVARRSKALALVTGEAVGQVSSQTLPNLAVISAVAEWPILRPLATSEKDEIVALARRIGTHDLSAGVPEYCALAPKHPETHAHLEAVSGAEAGLAPERLEAQVALAARFDLKALELDKIRAPELEVEEIESGDVVVDLRPHAAYGSWHYPGALRLDYLEALKAWPSLDRDKRYVFYCEVGLKSAHVAELMHRAGFRARHFRGGLRPLVRYYERLEPALRALLSPALLSDE